MTETNDRSQVDIERAVLGAMMIDPEAASRGVELVNEAVFYAPGHQFLFAAIKRLALAGIPADQLTLADDLKHHGQLDGVGGEATISTIMIETLSSANIDSHCAMLVDRARRRSLHLAASKIRDFAADPRRTTDAIIDEIEEDFSRIRYAKQDRGYAHIGDLVVDVSNTLQKVNEADGLAGITTGFKDVDDYIGGFQKGEVCVLAGKTGHGKSALAIDFALAAAKAGTPVGMFSLEMSSESVVKRFLQNEARFDMSRVYRERLNADDWRTIGEGGNRLCNLPIYICDRGGIPIADLVQHVRRMKKEHGIGLVVVDYLQLALGNGYNREQEVASISRALKAMAMEYHVPVVALSQFSRESDRRPGPPRRSDLRESGAIEQDASVILFVYKAHADGNIKDYGCGDNNRNVRELIIDKNRYGKEGRVLLYWQREFTHFARLNGQHAFEEELA